MFVGLGVGNELGNRFEWERWGDHHDKGAAADGRHWRKVADEIEAKITVEGRLDGAAGLPATDLKLGTSQRIGSSSMSTVW
jgi:hypothetical protein